VIGTYAHPEFGRQWLQQHRGRRPLLACVLGFTETATVSGISAAGCTPEARRNTAIADAEFLANGPQATPYCALPPLSVGASPALVARALVEALAAPIYLFDAGLARQPAVPTIGLGGQPARCLSTGRALPPAVAQRLLERGLAWGTRLGSQAAGRGRYLAISECVVGGTTTALALLAGLGIAGSQRVSSSHAGGNGAQKQQLAARGLQRAGLAPRGADPLAVAAAVGDPMQLAAAGMAIAASRHCGVLLAGGTQMLAVFALARALSDRYGLAGELERVAVGTTRWVAEDAASDTVGLACAVGQVPLLATQLSFARASYAQLRAYEGGCVKEGVGAGGCAIAASLYLGWRQPQLLTAIERMLERHQAVSPPS